MILFAERELDAGMRPHSNVLVVFIRANQGRFLPAEEGPFAPKQFPICYEERCAAEVPDNDLVADLVAAGEVVANIKSETGSPELP